MSGGAAKRVLLTRPHLDSQAIVPLLADRGIASVVAPLIEISDIDDAEIDLDGVQALLLTSANGARALARATARRDIPLLAVGDASARAAQAAGFANVASAGGDVGALVALARRWLDPSAGALLHVTGSAVAGDLAGDLARHGFSVRRIQIYRSHTADALPEQARRALAEQSIDSVMFYSPRTAAQFVNLVREAGLAHACQNITALCLSRAVAEALAGLAFAEIRIAETPDQASLFALLGKN